MTKHLILGGARSGKSRYAEQLSLESGKQVIYIATAQAHDAEMESRIAQHKHDRGHEWILIEEPLKLAQMLAKYDGAETCILIDCLTLWISNCLHNQCLEAECLGLLDILPRLQADLIMVSNEVGSGVVPLGQLSREFVDASGRLHQDLALLCQGVSLVVAGLPLALKNTRDD